MKNYSYLVESILCEGFKPNFYSNLNKELFDKILINAAKLDVKADVEDTLAKWTLVKGKISNNEYYDMVNEKLKAIEIDDTEDEDDKKNAEELLKSLKEKFKLADPTSVTERQADAFIAAFKNDEGYATYHDLKKATTALNNILKRSDESVSINESRWISGTESNDKEPLIKDPNIYRAGLKLYNKLYSKTVDSLTLDAEKKIEKLNAIGRKYKKLAARSATDITTDGGKVTETGIKAIDEVIGALTADYQYGSPTRVSLETMHSKFTGINSEYSGIKGMWKSLENTVKSRFSVKLWGKYVFDTMYWMCNRELTVPFISSAAADAFELHLALAYILTKLSRLENENVQDEDTAKMMEEIREVLS